MRAIFALAVIGMLAAVPGFHREARADVTYDFIPTLVDVPGIGWTTQTSGQITVPVPWDPGYYGTEIWTALGTSVTFTDAAVQSGHSSFCANGFNNSAPGCEAEAIHTMTPQQIIDTYGMVSCTDAWGCSPWALYSYWNLTFNPNGSLSGEISLGDADGDGVFTGSLGGRYSSPGGYGIIPIRGYWYTRPNNLPHPCCGHDPDPDPVPEPSSLALILPAIGIMIGLCRRRWLPAIGALILAVILYASAQASAQTLPP